MIATAAVAAEETTRSAIPFAGESASLDEEALRSLAVVREYLEAHVDFAVELVATVPTGGGSRDSQRVADLRLQEAFDQLTRAGVDAARISLRLAEGAEATRHVQVNFVPIVQREGGAPVTQASPVVRAEGRKVSLHFGLGATSLGESEATALNGVVAELLADSGAKVMIEAFTDATGTQTQNRTVSRLRSLKISERLVRSGVVPQRIQVLAGGELGTKTDSPKVREGYRRVDISTEPGPVPNPASTPPEVAPSPPLSPLLSPPPAPALATEDKESRWSLGLGVGAAFPLANLQDSFGRGLAAHLYFMRPLASLPGVDVGGAVGLTRFSRSDSDQSNSLKQTVVLAQASVKLPSPFESVMPACGAGFGGSLWQADSEEKSTGRTQDSSGEDLALEIFVSLQRAVADGASVELRLPFHKSFGDFGSQYLALTLGGALEL